MRNHSITRHDLALALLRSIQSSQYRSRLYLDLDLKVHGKTDTPIEDYATRALELKKV